MNKLKVLFIGIGSIAKRHIRNLQYVCSERGIEVCIDAFRRNYEKTDGINAVYTAVDDLPSDYDVIFITNPTECHLASFKVFYNKGRHFFIEKPVVSVEQIQEARKLLLRKESIYYVACPLRYNSVIQWLKHNVDPADVISVRSISSSYLPDWRPNQDYRNTYSAHKALGGGVSIDLIHEWDYLTYLFGWPREVKCMIGKKSGLQIDSEDYAVYIADYDNIIVELHLDYFGRKNIREIQLICKEDTIVGDIVNQSIHFLKSGEQISFDEDRDDYQRRELMFFLDMVTGKKEHENGYMHGLKVLELTQGKTGI